MTDDIACRLLITPAYLSNVGKLQRTAGSDDGRISDRLNTVIGTGETNEDLRTLGIYRASGRNGIAPLKSCGNVLRRYAEGGELLIGELYEYLLGLFAENVDLLHAGNMKHVLPDLFGFPDEIAHRHALRLESVKAEADVGIFVVHEWSQNTLRQVSGFIAELLTRLIKFFGDRVWRRIVLERDGKIGKAGARRCLDPVVPGQFLNTLLQRLGNEILHLACGCARPDSRNRQCLDGKGGVLSASQLDEGIDAGKRQKDDKEQRNGAFANRKGGQIEVHQFAASFVPTLVRTCAPSLRRCAPSATTSSPGLTLVTTTFSSLTRSTFTSRNFTRDDC
ncbi:hypothetical protein D3C71_1027440 [compost metagenome]